MTERSAHGARLIDEHAQESLMGDARDLRVREKRSDQHEGTILGKGQPDRNPSFVGGYPYQSRGSAGSKRARTPVQVDAS